MSILANLTRAQQAHRQQPFLMSEADLIAQYNAARRAYASAVACNDVDAALLWSDRANDLARQIAQMEEHPAIAVSYEPQSGDNQGRNYRAWYRPVFNTN